MDAYSEERAELLEQFAARFQKLRKASFPSQEAFADEAKLHRTEVGYLEQGRREPGLLTMLVLADTLGVSLDRLARGVPVPRERRPPPSERRANRDS